MKDKETYIEHCRRFIEKKGTTNLAHALGVSVAIVSNWKRRGIPAGYQLFLEKEYRRDWDQAAKS